MPTKTKPKTNRAKFTIEKKVAKPTPKPKEEKPEKEVKQVVAKPVPPKVEIKEPPQEEPMQEIPTKEAEEEPIEAISPQPEPEEPEPTISSSTHVPSQETQHEATAPIATPTEILNPFAPPPTNNPDLTPEHETPPAEIIATHEPIQTEIPTGINNPELSATLPKEEPTLPTRIAPVTVETEGKGRSLIIYFIAVALIAFLVGIGSMAAFTFGLKKVKMDKLNPLNMVKMNQSSPTPAKSKQPTSTPIPTKPVDLAAYNIKILNGSGITGQASKLKTQLTAAGFTVVSTANADKSDYTDTIISAKKDLDTRYLAKLKEILQKNYSLGSQSELPAASSKEADLIITIGATPAK